jgi:hypothetical protein
VPAGSCLSPEESTSGTSPLGQRRENFPEIKPAPDNVNARSGTIL